jgi:hypothetical protein
MEQQKFCDHCEYKSSCSETFSRLGSVQGPSVVKKVLVAFAMPIFVFIAVLVVSQQALEKYIKIEGLRTAAGFLLAFFAAAVCVLISWLLGRRKGKS